IVGLFASSFSLRTVLFSPNKMHMLVVEFRQVMCLLTFSSEASNSRTGLVTRTKLLQHNPLKHRLITIRDSTISNLMSGLSLQDPFTRHCVTIRIWQWHTLVSAVFILDSIIRQLRESFLKKQRR